MEQRNIEAVWLKRANRLSLRPAPAATGQNASLVLILGIGKERYGIDLRDVAEVLPPVRATPVPGAPAVFSGVVNVHGEIRPVLDLKRLLGMETARDGELTRVILLRQEGREMALQIDSVEQIRWVGSLDLQPPGNGGVESSPYIKGSTKELLMLLRTEALFAELQIGVTT